MNTKRKIRITLDYDYEFVVGRSTLVPGTEVSIRGKTGRFRFQYARKTAGDLDELTFVGGPLHGQGEQYISVYPSRVTRVHKNYKTLYNIQKEKTS